MLKNQKTKLLIALIALGVFSYAPQAISFGLGDIGVGSKTTSASTGGDPDAFIKTAASAEKLMNESVTHLVKSLASKKESADIEATMKAANTTTDAKEKQAKETEVKKSQDAALNEALNSADLKDKIKKMDSKQREALGASAFNFSLALLQDKSLSDQASGLISSMSSNPMNATKLASVKDVASSVSNQISSASKIAGKMPDIFTAVGVKAPATKDDKPMVIVQTDKE